MRHGRKECKTYAEISNSPDFSWTVQEQLYEACPADLYVVVAVAILKRSHQVTELVG